MKNFFPIIFSFGLLITFANNAEAKVCSCMPISSLTAVAGATAVSAAVGFGAYALATYDKVIGMTVSYGNRWVSGETFIGVPVKKIEKNAAYVVAGVSAAAGVLLGWKLFSRWTANGYLKKCVSIVVDGNCCQPDLLEIIKLNSGKPENIADFVVDRFSIRDNELVKSVHTLKRLYDDVLCAYDYLEIAQRRLNIDQLEKISFLKNMITDILTTTKDAIVLIKSCQNYEQQYACELQERKIRAEQEKADAIRYAANTPQIRYNV